MTEAGEQAPGRVVAGRYRLEDVLGRGGMGVVWRAVDTLIERTVALKELRPPQGEDATAFVERALREARNAGRLNHPGVVAVHDVLAATDDDPVVHIVMELVEAPSLAEVIDRDGPLPPARAAAIGVGILDALTAAHALGVVHRDIKPGNVLVLDGDRVKLTDFGIALAAEDSRLTRTGVMGTHAYLAPECFDDHQVGPATDLWALGATLFHAVAGTAPFERATTTATLRAILFEDPPPPPCGPPLADVIAGLLTRPVEQRLTAGGARELLARAAATAPTVEAPPDPDPGRAGWEAQATTLNRRPTPTPLPPGPPPPHTTHPGAAPSPHPTHPGVPPSQGSTHPGVPPSPGSTHPGVPPSPRPTHPGGPPTLVPAVAGPPGLAGSPGPAGTPGPPGPTGPPGPGPQPLSSAQLPAAPAGPAGPPGPPGPPAPPAPPGGRSSTPLLLGVLGVVAAILLVVIVTSGGDDDGGGTTAGPGSEQADGRPTIPDLTIPDDLTVPDDGFDDDFGDPTTTNDQGCCDGGAGAEGVARELLGAVNTGDTVAAEATLCADSSSQTDIADAVAGDASLDIDPTTVDTGGGNAFSASLTGTVDGEPITSGYVSVYPETDEDGWCVYMFYAL